jgi:hypothetical protein
VDCINLAQDRDQGSCKHGNKSSYSVKCSVFLDNLSSCWHLKEDCAPSSEILHQYWHVNITWLVWSESSFPVLHPGHICIVKVQNRIIRFHLALSRRALTVMCPFYESFLVASCTKH